MGDRSTPTEMAKARAWFRVMPANEGVATVAGARVPGAMIGSGVTGSGVCAATEGTGLLVETGAMVEMGTWVWSPSLGMAVLARPPRSRPATGRSSLGMIEPVAPPA